jgi:hypothetical protein
MDARVKKINPDSTVLSQMDEQWQKIVMLLLWKLNRGEPVKITSQDILAFSSAFAPNLPVLFMHGMADGFELSIVTEDAAKRIAEHDKQMRGSA